MKRNYSPLEQTLGYKFKEKKHLDTAFTHKSYCNEHTKLNIESYERYEYLGDAILEFLVSDYLFNNYPELSEGELTKLRASLVCEFTLSKISHELKLGDYIVLSKGEIKTGGCNRDSILCDVFEALLGAIYLDGGIENAKKYVNKFLLTDIEKKQLFYDAKSKLMIYAQKINSELKYELIKEEGPEHNKLYHVQVYIDDIPYSVGKGRNKKSAEQEAAYNTLEQLNNSRTVR